MWGYCVWRESILIDESFMIDNMTSTKLNRIVIKFALQHETIAKIVEVNDNGEFSVVDQITESTDEERYKHKDDKYNETSRAQVELNAFKNGKILFELSSDKLWLNEWVRPRGPDSGQDAIRRNHRSARRSKAT